MTPDPKTAGESGNDGASLKKSSSKATWDGLLRRSLERAASAKSLERVASAKALERAASAKKLESVGLDSGLQESGPNGGLGSIQELPTSPSGTPSMDEGGPGAL